MKNFNELYQYLRADDEDYEVGNLACLLAYLKLGEYGYEDRAKQYVKVLKDYKWTINELVDVLDLDDEAEEWLEEVFNE